MAKIGSLISLITNSELRYEGFLCYLDAENTTIGLQYVRSYGTEWRKKDGSHVPPSDTTYLYIYFHQRDIKDMMSRTLPSVQAKRLPNDPAIMQCFYSPPTYEPAHLLTAGSAQVTHTISNPQPVVLVPSFDRNYSLHPTVAKTGSTYPHPAMPIALPSFPGFLPKVSHIHQEHFPPPPSLIASLPFQQHTASSNVNAHSVLISPSIIEPHNSLIRPITTQFQNSSRQLPPWVFFSTVSGPTSVPPSSTTGSHIFTPSVHSSSSNHSSLGPIPKPSLFIPPNLSTNITSDRQMMDSTSQVPPTGGASKLHTATEQVTETKTSAPELVSQYSKLAPPLNPTLGTDNCSLDKIPVQPSENVLQKNGKELPSTQSLQIAKDDPNLIHMEASPKVLLSKSGSVKEPPQQSVQPQAREQQREYDSSPNNSYRRGKAIMPSEAPIQANIGSENQAKAREHGVKKYTEDFDFVAMNKKFNKEEVWRSLNKSNTTTEVTTGGGPQKLVKKHGYSEDGFFDTLTGDSDDQSGLGGDDLAAQRRIDNETFGKDQNDQESHGNQEPVRPRARGSRGSFKRRGRVNTGRGRGRIV